MEVLLEALKRYENLLERDIPYVHVYSDGSGRIGTEQVGDIENFQTLEEAIAWLKGELD